MEKVSRLEIVEERLARMSLEGAGVGGAFVLVVRGIVAIIPSISTHVPKEEDRRRMSAQR
jgi:hypothetical protein